jgi:hypothetical protein
MIQKDKPQHAGKTKNMHENKQATAHTQWCRDVVFYRGPLTARKQIFDNLLKLSSKSGG